MKKKLAIILPLSILAITAFIGGYAFATPVPKKPVSVTPFTNTGKVTTDSISLVSVAPVMPSTAPSSLLTNAIPLAGLGNVFNVIGGNGNTSAGGGQCNTYNTDTLTYNSFTLNTRTVSAGQPISGSVTVTNNHPKCSIRINDLAIGARFGGQPHTCPHMNCPYFVPGILNLTLKPGQSKTLTATFTTNTTGSWEAYPSYTANDGTGYWHDGPSIFFQVK